MQYILKEFTHDMGSRVFAFECIGKDRVRTQYSVSADLALIRRFGIRVQELPLLCRGILEQRDEAEERHAFTYTETDMGLYAEVCAAKDAAAKKKWARRPLVATKATSPLPADQSSPPVRQEPRWNGYISTRLEERTCIFPQNMKL